MSDKTTLKLKEVFLDFLDEYLRYEDFDSLIELSEYIDERECMNDAFHEFFSEMMYAHFKQGEFKEEFDNILGEEWVEARNDYYLRKYPREDCIDEYDEVYQR